MGVFGLLIAYRRKWFSDRGSEQRGSVLKKASVVILKRLATKNSDYGDDSPVLDWGGGRIPERR
jgi:hypothetical protein